MFSRQSQPTNQQLTLRVFKYASWIFPFGIIFFMALFYVIIPNIDKDRRLEGLAIDAQDNVYVADSAHQVIRKFDNQGNLLITWGSEGSGDGQFASSATGYILAIGPGNTIYALDQFNNRVQKFDSNGKFLAKFGSAGKEPGQLNWPDNMTVDNQGQIYIWDNSKLQKYDQNGNYLGNVGDNQPETGKLNGYRTLAVDTAGNVYVGTDAAEKYQVFNSQGQFLKTIVIPDLTQGRFTDIDYLAVDAQGNLYLADGNNRELVKADNSGKVIARLPLTGVKYNTARYSGIAFDSQNNTYVLKYYGSAIDIFDSKGQHLKEFSVGWPEWITDNFYLIVLFFPLFSLVTLIFERIYRKRHNLEIPTRKVDLTATSQAGKTSQFICLAASMFGILIALPMAAIYSVIDPGSITTSIATGGTPGPDIQKATFAWVGLGLYILVLILVFFVKKAPLVAGIIQIGAGFALFFLTDVLALKVLPVAIIIGGAFAILEFNEKKAAPRSNP